MMRIESSQYSWLATGTSATSSTTKNQPLGIESSSGSWCPQTGLWQTTNITAVAVVGIQKGALMSWHQGQSVNWRLIDYALVSGAK